MRHTYVKFNVDNICGYINPPGVDTAVFVREQFLRAAKRSPIDGELHVWVCLPEASDGSAPAVCIGHDVNLGSEGVRMVCSGDWRTCWPLFVAYVNLL